MTTSSTLRERVAHDPTLVLGAADLEELDAKFKGLDEDEDGEITRVELRRSLGGGQAAPFVTESRVDAFLRDMDLDGDGRLTFEELASATAVRQLEGVLGRIQRELEILDADSDADDPTVSGDVVEALLENLGMGDAVRRGRV